MDPKPLPTCWGVQEGLLQPSEQAPAGSWAGGHGAPGLCDDQPDPWKSLAQGSLSEQLPARAPDGSSWGSLMPEMKIQKIIIIKSLDAKVQGLALPRQSGAAIKSRAVIWAPHVSHSTRTALLLRWLS